MPYITSIDSVKSASVLVVNSARIHVDIYEDTVNNTVSNWNCESGVLEFFIFASALDNGSNNRFKKVQYDLQLITGFAPLPLINYLGYHFSKWDWVDADRITERN